MEGINLTSCNNNTHVMPILVLHQCIVPFYEAVLEGYFRGGPRAIFSGMEEIWYSRMGRRCSECGNEHHTLDTDAEELNGPLQATTKQKEFRIRN